MFLTWAAWIQRHIWGFGESQLRGNVLVVLQVLGYPKAITDAMLFLPNQPGHPSLNTILRFSETIDSKSV